MNRQVIELSLKLFGVVPKNESSRWSWTESSGYASKSTPEIRLKKSLKYGVFVTDSAAYTFDVILQYFDKNQLDAAQLNATFHKSWKVIQKSSRQELFIHQVLHYMTTYGTNFTSEFIYFPAEKLELPKLTKLPIRMIYGIERTKIIEKCLQLLTSGIALEEGTIDDILKLLNALNYKFTTVENIKNKEALVKIIAKNGVLPESPVEFLRYLIYKVTGSTLLIKNQATIETIKTTQTSIVNDLNKFGLKKCATIFNRFKPLWLAFKTNKSNRPLINEISRLSKRYHQPMPVDVLNTVTSVFYSEQQLTAALAKVNNFRKIRLLNALNSRLNAADTFLYRIRNGKSFARQKDITGMKKYYRRVFNLIYWDLVSSLSLHGLKVKYPDNIDYALPSTEKTFIGNYPAGTKITSKNLVSGVYWENAWGANDLDLSALSLQGKVGWNSAYKSNGLMYSGDVTNAPKGATELLYTTNNLPSPALSILNIYSGEVGCQFKIIVGDAPKVSANYMFNPNELIIEAATKMVGRQQILGIFLPEPGNLLSFVLVNAGFGNMSVSSTYSSADNARSALFYQYSSPVSFKQLLIDAGVIFVKNANEADINLMPQALNKNTFINLLNGKVLVR